MFILFFLVIYWFLLEKLKQQVCITSVFLKSFVCGLIAGTTAAVITLPLDVVKTRRQITLGELEISASKIFFAVMFFSWSKIMQLTGGSLFTMCYKTTQRNW